jgi:hypothetical protein
LSFIVLDAFSIWTIKKKRRRRRKPFSANRRSRGIPSLSDSRNSRGFRYCAANVGSASPLAYSVSSFEVVKIGRYTVLQLGEHLLRHPIPFAHDWSRQNLPLDFAEVVSGVERLHAMAKGVHPVIKSAGGKLGQLSHKRSRHSASDSSKTSPPRVSGVTRAPGIEQFVSGKLMTGVWLVFCAAVGGTRALRQYREAPGRRRWKIEAALSVLTLAVGAALVAMAYAPQ